MQEMLSQVNTKHNRPPSGAAWAADASGETAPLDFEQLCRRCMGRLDLAERLLASFERRFPLELVEIESCLAEGDLPRLVQLAHRLKGASANISAPRLHALMQRLEDAACGESPDAAAGLLTQLQSEWEKFNQYKGSARLS